MYMSAKIGVPYVVTYTYVCIKKNTGVWLPASCQTTPSVQLSCHKQWTTHLYLCCFAVSDPSKRAAGAFSQNEDIQRHDNNKKNINRNKIN